MNFSWKDPAVSRKTLVMTAGLIWAAAGLFLIMRPVEWFDTTQPVSYLLAGAGIVVGLAKSRYIFSHIVARNVNRIKSLSPHKEHICIFAFQAWLSYLIVIIMISLGYILRSTPISRFYLVAIYVAIGVALGRSSLEYFKAAREL